MKYKPLTLIIILLALIFIIFDSNDFLHSKTLLLGDKTKILFFESKENIKLFYEKYMQQAHSIEEYKAKLQDYSKLQLQFQTLQTRFNQLSEFLNQKMPYQKPDFIPTRSFSYVTIGNYNRIWLDFDISSYPKNKIFGIVQDGNALGIATIKNNRLMGLLNGDENSSYVVHIGKDKIPAIIRYNSTDPEKILADFIPSWMKVNIGDEVITSGLDGIFTPNIPVGKITNIIQNYGYITAEIIPYAKKNHPEYVWLVDTKKPQTNFSLEKDNK
ncbi:rod shape-determining protein MreC [Helicobacter sp. 13S00477-4]|uniref:rod shape-determining protein MreC n=1 Tax=Helicobacter sp. 13S00477-4 TaxID=1905759 RepID=UPI000BA5C994|nr:rod shape-determining protein MreC [Helicobacter sp. 13S00477-4]PAF52440.1 rod shape-determining protein MreC [Helicobacter sp. 13S00477-4]